MLCKRGLCNALGPFYIFIYLCSPGTGLLDPEEEKGVSDGLLGKLI